MRAGIVLRAAKGASNTEIARDVRVSLQTVGLWRLSAGWRAWRPRRGRDGCPRRSTGSGVITSSTPHQVRSFRFPKDPQLHPADIADQAWQSGPDDARRQAQRHHQALRRSGDCHWRGDRQLLPAAQPPGVPRVPQLACPGVPRQTSARRDRQRLNALQVPKAGVRVTTQGGSDTTDRALGVCMECDVWHQHGSRSVTHTPGRCGARSEVSGFRPASAASCSPRTSCKTRRPRSW
jgi:hypothetical protein